MSRPKHSAIIIGSNSRENIMHRSLTSLLIHWCDHMMAFSYTGPINLLINQTPVHYAHVGILLLIQRILH
jgi:hypothetical protein